MTPEGSQIAGTIFSAKYGEVLHDCDWPSRLQEHRTYGQASAMNVGSLE